MSEENIQPNNNPKSPKNIHTYMSDMAEVVRQNEMSVIKIAVEEQKRRETTDYYQKIEKQSKGKIFWIIGGLIILAGAIALTYFTLQKKKEINTPPVIIKTPETLISFDMEESIDFTNIINKIDVINIFEKELATREASESIKAIFLKKQTNEIQNTLLLESFISSLKTNIPSSLLRSFSPDYMIGTYTPVSLYDKSHLFLILKINDYNQAYAGMLEWEKTMLTDLFSLFNIKIDEKNKDLFEKSFKDIIIKNKDARILYTSDGTDILFYLFPDKNTLIISDNQEAVKEIITRLLAKQSKPL